MGQGTGQVKQQPAQSAGRSGIRKHHIIVSFTTTSSRIKYINQMVRSLYQQSMVPNEIYMWISKEPFLHDEGIPPEEIPKKLQKLANFEDSHFNIRYTENVAGYRKLLPILEENKNRDDVVIITADDDIIYPERWLENLYQQFIKDNCIIACRARKITYSEDGTLIPYESWPLLNSWDYHKELQLCPTGNAGVLYLPAFFDDRIFDPVFKTLSPTRADFWYAANAIVNNVLTRHIPSTKPMPELGYRVEFPAIRVPVEVKNNWNRLYETNRPKNDEYAKKVFKHFSIIN